MGQNDRRDNLLGAFVLTVADRIRDETEAVLGHSGAVAAALASLAQQPGGTVEDLRRAIGRSHPATVRIVDRLVGLGLVERRRAGGGPAVALTATASGRKRAREILAVRRGVLADALAGLQPDEDEALTMLLERALTRLAEVPPESLTICRLCDKGRCRRADCPVVRSLAAQGEDLPPPTVL